MPPGAAANAGSARRPGCGRGAATYRRGVGGHPYYYYVPYEPDLQAALDKLRAREFIAGRYHPAMPFIDFGEPALFAQGGGARHRTIDEALQDSGEIGTRSILDIDRISDEPDFCAAAPVEGEALDDLYGTTRPTRDMLGGLDFLDGIERGQAVYLVVYRDGTPDQILFAGYSVD